MKLLDLNPELRVLDEPPTGYLEYDCPQCFGKPGDHRIGNFIDVTDVELGKMSRPLWGLTGSSFKDLSLTGSRMSGLRSTRVMGGCKGHWDIVNGEIIFHGDSGQ